MAIGVEGCGLKASPLSKCFLHPWPMAYQTFTHQIWWVMVCYDLAHQIRWAKHTFSGRCDITPMVCCSFGGHSTPQFLQCSYVHSIFGIVGRAKQAPHWGVQSRFRVIYIYLCVCRGPKCARRITWPNTCMLKVSLGRLKPTSDTLIIHFDYMLEQL